MGSPRFYMLMKYIVYISYRRHNQQNVPQTSQPPENLNWPLSIHQPATGRKLGQQLQRQKMAHQFCKISDVSAVENTQIRRPDGRTYLGQSPKYQQDYQDGFLIQIQKIVIISCQYLSDTCNNKLTIETNMYKLQAQMVTTCS